MNRKELLSQLREQAASIYTYTFQRAYFRVLGHPIERRFVIIGNARTGSNYLLDGLRTSPSVRAYHEIFAAHNRKVGQDFEKILSTVYQYESRVTQVVGFKVFYNHLDEAEWKKFLASEDLQLIHLTRRNRLRTVISLEIAFKTGRWTKSGNSQGPKEKRVTLDPSKLVERIEKIEAGECLTRVRFEGRPMLEIVYEDLVREPERVFALVGTYLGIDGIDPHKIKLKRQNPESLQDLIINYNEVEAALRNTRFEEYLHS
jgi:LPS sulfotransferase NodH